MDPQTDWEKAEQKLRDKLEQYQELVDMPGVNPWFVLGMLSQLKARLDRGERTQALYDDIMDLE